jgi:hypothetical protein
MEGKLGRGACMHACILKNTMGTKGGNIIPTVRQTNVYPKETMRINS